MSNENQPFFYRDPEMSFDSAFLQGIDYYLSIMDALILAYINWI